MAILAANFRPGFANHHHARRHVLQLPLKSSARGHRPCLLVPTPPSNNRRRNGGFSRPFSAAPSSTIKSMTTRLPQRRHHRGPHQVGIGMGYLVRSVDGSRPIMWPSSLIKRPTPPSPPLRLQQRLSSSSRTPRHTHRTSTSRTHKTSFWSPPSRMWCPIPPFNHTHTLSRTLKTVNQTTQPIHGRTAPAQALVCREMGRTRGGARATFGYRRSLRTGR